MHQVDPFVRSCFLAVVVAAFPAILLASFVPEAPPFPTYTYAALAYAAALLVLFFAGARTSPIWKTPIVINVPFYAVLALLTLTV